MRAACCLALCLFASAAWADWTFLPKWTEPQDGYDTRAAANTNVDGYSLHLYRNPIGRVYARFALPEGAGDLLTEGTVATLTPQGFAPKQIEARREQGRVVEYATSTGRALRDRLWHGEGQAPAFGTFHDMLQAPAITVTFTLADGTSAETSWSMDSAARPIAQALGISTGGIPAGAEWEDAAAQSLLAAMTACQFPKLDVICVQEVTACSAKISDDRDIDGFEACVAAQ
ncbi:MAG: hypothetical protein AAFQ19_08340 [Pseudomonadota bacterium]